jgi:multidrug resistance efflux pump
VQGRGARLGAGILLGLILGSLLLYFVADRMTPHTSQARVQAFVVPIAAEVAGKVLEVGVSNNDEVQAGQLLFVIDPSQYEIALARSRSDHEAVRRSVNASAVAIEAAQAALLGAEAKSRMSDVDALRQERLYTEDPGAISLRRLEMAQSTRVEARSSAKRAEAELRRAQEVAGDAGEQNAQLQSAKAAVEKAALDLARTRVIAPTPGVVTDLRVDVGHFAQAGAPLMTLISARDIWISADMTENNLGRVDPGDKVAITLDVMPGRILQGRVRSIGGGVSAGQQVQPGTLPTIQNSRDWLRQAQRFPVAIEFDASALGSLDGVRVGGQADVLVFTGDNPLINALGSAYIRLMSLLSFLY